MWVDNGKEGGIAFDECLKILEDSWYEIANDRNLEEWDRKEREGYIKQTQIHIAITAQRTPCIS